VTWSIPSIRPIRAPTATPAGGDGAISAPSSEVTASTIFR
jgi:hypothetical protein